MVMSILNIDNMEATNVIAQTMTIFQTLSYLNAKDRVRLPGKPETHVTYIDHQYAAEYGKTKSKIDYTRDLSRALKSKLQIQSTVKKKEKISRIVH